jgi:hypothetical protein
MKYIKGFTHLQHGEVVGPAAAYLVICFAFIELAKHKAATLMKPTLSGLVT